MFRPVHARAAAASLMLVAALSVSACSSGAPAAEDGPSAAAYHCNQPNADTMTTVSLSMLPILSTGALYAGVDQGYFAENGLELQIEDVSTMPAAIAAVQGGATDFAFAGTFPLMQALQSGVPVSIVAPYAGIAPGYFDKMQANEPGYTTEVTALLTMADSGLDSPADLDDKTVAVSDVQGQSELTTRYVIDEDGGDSESVTFTVMSAPDAYNALLAGQVDAAASAVPFILNADSDGAQIISWPGVETLHEGPTSTIVAANDFSAANPEVVARFNCAVRSSTAYANEHPEAVRAALAAAQGVDVATYESAVVPYFYSEIDLEGVERFEQLMLDYGFLTGKVDWDSAIDSVALSSN